MTPAIIQLDKLAIPYQLHQYQHDANNKAFGLEAVTKLNLDPSIVFKTLVVEVNNDYLAVAILPVAEKLNLKKLAKVLKAKKVVMAPANKVQTSTGYVLGGVSPLGQKKHLTTVIALQAEALATMYISGGKRGLEIALSPIELEKALSATVADICYQ